MKELTEALGPWPILQFLLGVALLGGGIYAIVAGIRSKNEASSMEDKRAEWAAYEQLKNIEQNSFRQVQINEKILIALNSLITIVWNNEKMK